MPTVRSAINVKKCVLSSALLIAALSPCIAAAALGEPETSVQTDAAGLRGSIKVTPQCELSTARNPAALGNHVREFAGPRASIAVAWNGPTVPNLRQTLGRYFDDYVTAAKPAHGTPSSADT